MKQDPKEEIINITDNIIKTYMLAENDKHIFSYYYKGDVEYNQIMQTIENKNLEAQPMKRAFFFYKIKTSNNQKYTGHFVQPLSQDLQDLGSKHKVTLFNYDSSKIEEDICKYININRVDITEFTLLPIVINEDQNILYRIKGDKISLLDFDFTTDKLTAATNKILNVYRITKNDKLIPIPYTSSDELKLSYYEKVKSETLAFAQRRGSPDLPITRYLIRYFDDQKGTVLTIEVVARTLKSLFRKLEHIHKIKTKHVLWVRTKENPEHDLYVRKVEEVIPKRHMQVTYKPVKHDRKVCIMRTTGKNESGHNIKEYKRVWRSELGKVYNSHEWTFTSKKAFKSYANITKIGKTIIANTQEIICACEDFKRWNAKKDLYKQISATIPYSNEYNVIKKKIQEMNYIQLGETRAIISSYPSQIKVTEILTIPHVYIKPPIPKNNFSKKSRKLEQHFLKNLVYINKTKCKRKGQKPQSLSNNTKLKRYYVKNLDLEKNKKKTDNVV